MPGPSRQSGYPAVRRAAVAGGLQIPPGIAPVSVQSGQPGALSPEQGIWVRLPAANFPPAGGSPVDELGNAVLAAGGAAGLMLTIPVPAGQRFTLAQIGFSASDETSLQFFTWTIFFGPNPLPGYINKSAVIGTLGQAAAVDVVTQATQPVTVMGMCSAQAGTHLGVAISYTYFARIRGWFYAEQEGV
jgi:hypothetical protein